jgi:hypothetical protein
MIEHLFCFVNAAGLGECLKNGPKLARNRRNIFRGRGVSTAGQTVLRTWGFATALGGGQPERLVSPTRPCLLGHKRDPRGPVASARRGPAHCPDPAHSPTRHHRSSRPQRPSAARNRRISAPVLLGRDRGRFLLHRRGVGLDSCTSWRGDPFSRPQIDPTSRLPLLRLIFANFVALDRRRSAILPEYQRV